MRDALVFLSTSEEALEVYRALREALQADGLQLRSSLPLTPHDLGSAPLQQVRHTQPPHLELTAVQRSSSETQSKEP